MITRRQLLQTSGQGFGALALSSLDASEAPQRALTVAPKAKRVVQLFMGGAASHIDLFDFKPALIKHHGEDADFGEAVEAFQNGLGPWKKPVWDFKPYGQSGKRLSDVVAPLGLCADDMAFVHNMVGKTGVHSQGTLLQATGFNLPGFPGMGCWVSYGLGSLSDNLPTFVVLPDHRGFASNGPKNWDSAFLPSQHAGTIIYPGAETPINDLFPHKSGRYIKATSDRSSFALLKQLTFYLEVEEPNLYYYYYEFCLVIPCEVFEEIISHFEANGVFPKLEHHRRNLVLADDEDSWCCWHLLICEDNNQSPKQAT